GGAISGTGGGSVATGGAPGSGGVVAGTGGGTNGTGGANTGAGGVTTDASAPDGGGDAGPAGTGGGGDAGPTGTGGSAGDASADDGAPADGGALLGTPARPLLPPRTADGYTIAKYLAQAGSLLTGLVVDNWNPTAGVGDVATFTPTYTVAADGSGTHTTVQAALSAAMSAAGTSRVYIRVMPGTYREIVCLKSPAPPITLYGTSADASQ